MIYKGNLWYPGICPRALDVLVSDLSLTKPHAIAYRRASAMVGLDGRVKDNLFLLNVNLLLK